MLHGCNRTEEKKLKIKSIYESNYPFNVWLVSYKKQIAQNTAILLLKNKKVFMNPPLRKQLTNRLVQIKK